MKKAILLLFIILSLGLCAFSFAEETEESVYATVIEGQTIEFTGFPNMPIVNWDEEHLEKVDKSVFRAIKPGQAFIDSNYIGDTGPYIVSILPRTEIPEWLPGAWEAKITGGSDKGRRCRYYFHDDGTVHRVIYGSSANNSPVNHFTYVCADGFLRFNEFSGNEYVAFRLENETIIPIQEKYIYDYGDRYAAFQRVKKVNFKMPKDIALVVQKGKRGKKDRFPSEKLHEEVTITEGAPAQWVISEFDKAPDYRSDKSLCFHSTDPSVAILDFNTGYLRALKPGTAEVWATMYADESVVSNRITVHVEKAEEIPQGLMGYMWQETDPRFGATGSHYVFCPDGTIKEIILQDDYALVLDAACAFSGGLLFTESPNYFGAIVVGKEDKAEIRSWPRQVLRKGFERRGGNLVYYDDHGIPVSGWFEADWKTYYADSLCRILTGVQIINHIPYRFDDDGALEPHQYANKEQIWSFVQRCYSEFLGITEENDEMNAVVKRIMEDEITPIQFAHDLLFTEDAQKHLDSENQQLRDEKFIAALSRVYLLIYEYEDIYDLWRGRLERGMNREDIVEGFVHTNDCEMVLGGMMSP